MFFYSPHKMAVNVQAKGEAYAIFKRTVQRTQFHQAIMSSRCATENGWT